MKAKIWNLEAIKAELESAECQDDGWGNHVKMAFLGTVFALTPSGKYYTPFASSNVAECPRCHGEGHTKKTYECEYCQGTGKRDVMSCRHQNESLITCATRLESLGAVVHYDNDGGWLECWVCQGTGRAHHTCAWCGGLGSREAYLDEKWTERAEKELASIGASLQSGDGDPCDLFAVMVCDDVEDTGD